MNCIFHPEANQEFLDAIDYYESIQSGLGEDFYLEIMAAVQRVAKGPEMWPILKSDIRRCLAHRFPYAVLYSIEPDGLYFVAVMHLRRNADYWISRVD